MKEIEFRAEKTIRLKDLLKAADIVSSGGMAKNIIKDQGVILNGESCFVPGKQLNEGDQIIFDDYLIKIV